MAKYERILTEYRTEWTLLNPKPRRRRSSLARDYTQFLMFVPVAIIGPVVSAFRTAALISAHTAFSDPLPLWVETVGATLLFEWAVIAYQAERLRRKLKNDGSLGKVGTWQIWVGLTAAVGAVTVSNLVEIGIAALEKAGVEVPLLVPAIAIGLFLGLGIPIMSLVAGEIVGRFILEYQVRLQQLEQEHLAAVAQWEERFVRSWNSRKRTLLQELVETPPKPTPDFAQRERSVADGHERCWCGAEIQAKPQAKSAHARRHANDVRKILANVSGAGLETVAAELEILYGQRPSDGELRRLYNKYRTDF